MKYKPEYPANLIVHMSKGFSFESFAADCDCTRNCLYDWADRYPEFKVAKEIGQGKTTKFLESLAVIKASGQNTPNVRAKDIDTTMAIFLLKTRLRDIYGEKVQVELSGDADFLRSLDKSQYEQIAEIAKKEAAKKIPNAG